MRQLFLAAICGLGLGHAAAAQTIPATIEDTVLGQIEALSAHDFGAAFAFTSEDIQRAFGTPDRFGQMVKAGFAMVISPKNVVFLNRLERGGDYWQRVMVTDMIGARHVLDYQIIATEFGWKINGVVRLSDFSAKL